MSARTRNDAPPVAGSDAAGPEAESEAKADAGQESLESREAGSFESSLEELESVVDRLEAGDLPLEEALAAFEQGVALARRCAARLEAAERRIEVLVQEGANWVARPFDESEETD